MVMSPICVFIDNTIIYIDLFTTIDINFNINLHKNISIILC